MLALGDASEPLDHAIASRAGGFGWWYGDLLDEHGNGVVVIAAFGLPFLPGLVSSARAGRPIAGTDRPSLNVVVYRAGRAVLYLLQELDPADVSWEAGTDRARFGRTSVASRWVGDRRVLRVHLDAPLPGSTDRLTGRVRIEGPAARPTPTAGSEHRWTPLSVGAVGEADLRVAGRTVLRTAGAGYHDRNVSPDPIDRLGIRHWLWGRLPGDDAEQVFYLLWPEGGGPPIGHLLDFSPDGSVRHEPVDVALSRTRLGWFGLRWWRSLTLTRADGTEVPVTFQRVVDDGPFYLRFLVTGPSGRPAFAERVVPGRVDRAWSRPFVRMCVDGPAERSWLAPWFLGLREGRWARLVGSFGPPRLGVAR